MTARERMKCALNRGKPDRIPIALVGDSDFYCKAVGKPLWALRYGSNDDAVEIFSGTLDRFPSNDYMRVMGFDHETVASRRVVYENSAPYLENPKTGERSPIHDLATASDWSYYGDKPVSQHSQASIKSEADIERVLGPIPTKEALLAGGSFDSTIGLRAEKSENVYLSYWAGGIFFFAQEYVGGFEPGIMMSSEDPHLMRSLMDQLALRTVPTIEAAAAAGADAAWIGGFMEGADFISPQTWRDICLPAYRIQVKAAHQNGLQVLFWFLVLQR